jgi:predicted ATP-grasp superfamily ATP-dependent carboligase
MLSNVVVRERAFLDDLREPILITAFSSMQKGGATGPAALGYALEQLEARPVAEIDAMECYNFARMRPWVRREGETTVVDWPRNVVYRYEAPEQTVLALVGVEPTLNWPGFVSAIADFAQRAGVETAVNLKAVGAVVPHTSPSPLRAIYSQPDLISEFGVPVLDEQDGPGDIGRILNLQLAASGCRTVDVYACEPFYSTFAPDANASLALVKTVQRIIGAEIDSTDLEATRDMQRQAIDMATQQSQQLHETVHAVDQRAREAGFIDNPRLQLNEPNAIEASDVLAEAESILGSLRPGGPE